MKLLAFLTFVFFVCAPASAQQLPYPWLELCAKGGAKCEREVSVQDLADLHRTISTVMQTLGNEDPLDPWTAFPARAADGKIYGDCDDQAATERAVLIGFGIDPKAMKFVTGKVREPDGREVGHIILVVELDGSQWVLDRRMPEGLYLFGSKMPGGWKTTAIENHAGAVWLLP